MSKLRQAWRFGLVGVLNTGIYYALYLPLIMVVPYVIAHVLAWVVAMTISFYLNSVFTYRVTPSLRSFVLYPLTNIPNALVSTLGVVSFVEALGVSEQLAPLLAGLIAVPATFFITRWILTSPRTARPTALAARTEVQQQEPGG